MSTTIEREVVQMVFDARQFQTGVQQSIEGVEALKKSFNFKGAQDSMGELTKMGQGDHFGPMSKSLDALNSKISLIGVAAAAAVTRLTNAVIDGSKALFNSLILDPIRTGLEEYETQLNAVQTILANTKKDGTTLEYVNEKLDELNTYADLTIYNFTQMTDSIGKFTAAGVDIDTSVSAIKGIANVAALSGSNAQQASTAMYQLSQAMASGTVRLQDWMSVENAGMGGAVFQDALIETARVHGIAVDDMIEKNGSFRLSLQEGWLSSDLMAETLKKFTGDLTDAELESIGYTKEQIAAIQEMAIAANDAATKIKTLTQLKDTMAEAMQSGWGQTWRIVFGDFEQAKQLWGGIAETFGGIIDQSSTARNTMLEMWAEVGGREALIQGFMNVLQAVINILGAFGSAVRSIFEPLSYVDLFQITLAFFQFSQRLLDFSENLGPFQTIVKGIAAAIDILKEVVLAVVRPIWEMVQSIMPAGDGFLNAAVGIAEAVIAFREMALETGLFDTIVANVITKIGEFIARIRELVEQISELEVIQDITTWLQGLETQDFVRIWEGILVVVKAVVAPIYAVALAMQALYIWVSKLDITQRISEYFQAINYSQIKDGFRDIAASIRAIIDSVKNHEVLKAFGDFFATFDGRRFTAYIENAKTGLGGFIETLKGFNKASKETPDNVEKMADSVAEGNETIAEKLSEGLARFTDSAGSLDYSKIFEALNVGLFAGLVLSIKKIADMDLFGSILGDELSEGIADSIEGLTGVLSGMETNLKAEALKSIAVAIALLAASLALLTLINTTKLLAATAAIAAFVAALFGATGALKNVDVSAATKATIVMAGVAASMVILAIALKALQGLDPSGIETTISVMAAGIASLVLAVTGLSKGVGDTKTAQSIGLMLGLAGALYLLHGAIRRFGEMDPNVLSQGILGISGSLGVLITAMVAVTRMSSGGLIKAAISITEMAANLFILAAAVSQFGEMDADVLAQGLASIAAVMLGFAVASQLLRDSSLLEASVGILGISVALLVLAQGVKSFGGMNYNEIVTGLLAMAGALAIVVIAGRALNGALPGAAAMTIMSVALLGFAVALKFMSTIPWEGLLVGLVGIAGIFLILGLAGVLLAPVVPVLLGLGAAMTLIGLGAAAFGLGISLAATGLVALAASAAAIATGIGVVATAVISVLPGIAAAIAEAFVSFLQVMADNTPKIVEAMKTIILGMIEAIWGLIPDIVDTIMELMTELLDAIASRLPDMIQSGIDIIMAFLDGILQNVAEIIATGLRIVAEVINGIAEGIPDLIDSAFNLILTFLNAMADAIEEYTPQIISAGGRIGIALVEGIVKGLTDNAQQVYDFVKGMANKAIDKIKQTLGITSPAKATIEVGYWLAMGLIKGLRNNTSRVVDAMEEFALKAQNGMSSLESYLQEGLDANLNYNPVITPVLDLSKITSGAARLDTAFGRSRVLASIAADDSTLTTAIIGSNQPGSVSGGVVFNQYNYSPKALDPTEIFRKTKTQVAKVAL